jgi:hypothetical protein
MNLGFWLVTVLVAFIVGIVVKIAVRHLDAQYENQAGLVAFVLVILVALGVIH